MVMPVPRCAAAQPLRLVGAAPLPYTPVNLAAQFEPWARARRLMPTLQSLDASALHGAQRGVRSILTRSLALAKHDELLVIADENHAAEIVVISEVASRLGIAVSSLVIPAPAQRRVTAETALPALVRAAIPECRS